MSRSVFVVDLEPLEERYTGQWARWIPEMLAPLGSVARVGGEPLASSVTRGAFLDLYSHAHYQAGQLAHIARLFNAGLVRDGDLFWFSDIEFPGMEQVRYLARLSGIKVVIAGFLHAASYTRGDFMQPMQDVGHYAECAWIAACDLVFVGSAHHKRDLVVKRLRPARAQHLAVRVVVTGNPFRSREVCDAPPTYAARCIDVLYPHRPDAEKQPGLFLDLARVLVAQHGMRVAFTTGRREYRASTPSSPEVDAILNFAAAHPERVTVHVGLTRRAFFSLMTDAKVVVSTTVEENFGYAMAEAIACGALPYMPARFSHPELLAGAKSLTAQRVLYETAAPSVRDAAALVREGSARFEAERPAILAHLDGAETRIVAALRKVLA
jgi:hypothetical protein